MFFLLLALQQAPDSTYATPALRDVVERAAVYNAAAAGQLRPFAAQFQSSIGVVRRLPDNVEGSATIEQMAGIFRWTPQGVFQQHQTGYRVITVGVPLPGASLLANGWVVPPLFGEHLPVLVASRPLAEAAAPDSLWLPLPGALHPLSLDRARLYSFRGGDTVEIETPDRLVERLVRVEVWPRTDLAERTQVFRGSLYLDPRTGGIRRIRGQILAVGGERSGMSKVLGAVIPGATLIDVLNTEVPGLGLFPTFQWIELQAHMPLSNESYTTIRLVTRLGTITTEGDSSLVNGPVNPTAAGLTRADPDSLGSYRAWSFPPGDALARVRGRELADVGPVRARPSGPPTLALRGTSSSDFIRYNRVEGLFLGAAGTLRFRDAVPGLSLRGGAGYAFASDMVRPQLSLTWARNDWILSARGERAIDLATKFPDPLDYGRGLRAVFASDNYDYIDRWKATLGVSRYLNRRRAGIARVEAGWTDERATPALVDQGPFGQQFLPNPGVDPGRYLRTLVRLEVSPEVSPRFARPGVGFRLRYERGDGDLEYNRYQVGLTARANAGRALFTLVGDAGVVTGVNMPAQQLFLLGGLGSLPGYEYDQFAGDKAWLARALVSIPLPFLDNPIPVGSGLSLPPVNPSVSFRFYAGQAEADDPPGLAAIGRLGTRPAADGSPVPYAVPSNGPRATVEFRLTLFGSLLGFGVARPLEPGATWKFQFALAQVF